MRGTYYGTFQGPRDREVPAATKPVATVEQIDRIVSATFASDGHTEHLPTGEAPTSGYMVGTAGTEQTTPAANLGFVWLARYIRTHANLLRRFDSYLGLWIETDESTGQKHAVAEVSVWVRTQAEAQARATQEHQRAIFDVANRSVIEVAKS